MFDANCPPNSNCSPRDDEDTEEEADDEEVLLIEEMDELMALPEGDEVAIDAFGNPPPPPEAAP